MSLEDELESIVKKGVDRSAEEMIKAVEDAYGEVPYFFEFMRDHPELLITKILHTNAVMRSSTLDMKTVELISIAVSAALRCSHCLRLHIRVASNLGVPVNEIATAIYLAGNLVNASVLATATRHLDEERDICRVCETGNGRCEIHRQIEIGSGRDGPPGSDYSNTRFWETTEDHRFALEVLQLRIRREILKFMGREAKTLTEIEKAFGLKAEQARYHLALLEKALMVEQAETGYRCTSAGILYLERVESKG